MARPNACAQHHVGDIGLTGLSLKGQDGQEATHYSILVGGAVGEEDAVIGQRLAGRYPEAEVPGVIAALAEHYRARRLPGEPFRVFARRVGTKDLSDVARAAAVTVN